MLRLLRIRNFAIIDELELELTSGLNAITGETGAGKSIILEAVGLVLGNRATLELIRAGSDEATVEALFDAGEQEMLVKRAIHRSGKNKIYFNGELITLAQLSDACANLVDLCSQHEHQSLAKPAYQLELIDSYGGLMDRRTEAREMHSALRSCENELAMLRGGSEAARARTEDFARFQLAEIDEFGPREGEEEELSTERRRLLNATQLAEAVAQARALLGGDEALEAGDARSLLARASQRIAKGAQLDTVLAPALEAVGRASLEVDEALGQLGRYGDALEANPARLEEIEARLARWGEMRRKYGASAAEILAARSKIENELGNLEYRKEMAAALATRLEATRLAWAKAAGELSKRRKNVVKTLRESIRGELKELMMPESSFEVEVSSVEPENGGADGIDRAQFLFSANAGEEPKPLGRIASGGELSRVMLAIRRVISDRGGIGVYVFDEIDAGIGGQTASVVGRKLKSVARHNQVICITHLPQVAAYADAHYSVSKRSQGGRTLSRITRLEAASRVDELARMLGGLQVTEKSRAHARDLVRQAGALK